MNSDEVKAEVVKVIREIAEQSGISLPELTGKIELVDDLGFSSLLVAALIANLEEVFGIDPFLDENVHITDVRTLSDLCRIYVNSLAAE